MKQAWLGGHPHLIKNLEKKYGNIRKRLQEQLERELWDQTRKMRQVFYGVYWGSDIVLIRPWNVAVLGETLETQYSKCSAWTIKSYGWSNAASCSKRDEASNEIFVEHKILWHGLNIESLVNCINPDWIKAGHTESDYAGDKYNLISMSDFIIFLLGVVIMRLSKAQKWSHCHQRKQNFAVYWMQQKRSHLHIRSCWVWNQSKASYDCVNG